MDEASNPHASDEPIWPTEPLWPHVPAPESAPRHDTAPQQDSAPPRPETFAAPPGGRRARGTGARWAIGIGAVAVLAGASVLGVTLSDGASGGTAQAARAVLTGSAVLTGGARNPGSQASGGGHGTAATAGAFGFASGSKAGGARSASAGHDGRARLHGCVASARHLRATGHMAAARARLRACARFLRRHGALGGARARLARLAFLARRAEHAQITVATKNGAKTVAFERGTVQSVSGTSVVVKTADGVTWTWQVWTKTRVFQGGHLAGARALADGQRIAVAGLVSGGTDQARRARDQQPARRARDQQPARRARGQQPARRARWVLIRPSA
jgi:hypothetical protein